MLKYIIYGLCLLLIQINIIFAHILDLQIYPVYMGRGTNNNESLKMLSDFQDERILDYRLKLFVNKSTFKDFIYGVQFLTDWLSLNMIALQYADTILSDNSGIKGRSVSAGNELLVNIGTIGIIDRNIKIGANVKFLNINLLGDNKFSKLYLDAIIVYNSSDGWKFKFLANNISLYKLNNDFSYINLVYYTAELDYNFIIAEDVPVIMMVFEGNFSLMQKDFINLKSFSMGVDIPINDIFNVRIGNKFISNNLLNPAGGISLKLYDNNFLLNINYSLVYSINSIIRHYIGIDFSF